MRPGRLTAIWLAIVIAMTMLIVLRLTDVLPGDTLDFVVGLGGLALSFSTLGMLILRTNPGHRIGTLFMVLAADETVVEAMRLVATSMDPHSHIAGGVAIFEEALRVAGLTGAAVVILMFPTGRLLSPRWRIAVGLLAVVTVLGALNNALTPGVMSGVPPVVNPWATPGTARIARAIAPAASLGGIVILAAAASLIIRLRTSSERERRQVKVFALSVLFVVVTIVGCTVALPNQMNNGLLGSLVWQLPWIVPPAAAAYAIVRHGLFDIDRFISRTVSYAVITVVLAGTFAGIVLVPSAAVGATGAPSWLIAVATLAVVVLFQPLRGRIQRAVDQRFNRARYDAVNTVQAFAARLRDEIDMDALETELSEVVARTMQPRHVGLWLTPSRRS
jgi:hypothetical protein